MGQNAFRRSAARAADFPARPSRPIWPAATAFPGNATPRSPPKPCSSSATPANRLSLFPLEGCRPGPGAAQLGQSDGANQALQPAHRVGPRHAQSPPQSGISGRRPGWLFRRVFSRPCKRPPARSPRPHQSGPSVGIAGPGGRDHPLGPRRGRRPVPGILQQVLAIRPLAEHGPGVLLGARLHAPPTGTPPHGSSPPSIWLSSARTGPILSRGKGRFNGTPPIGSSPGRTITTCGCAWAAADDGQARVPDWCFSTTATRRCRPRP